MSERRSLVIGRGASLQRVRDCSAGVAACPVLTRHSHCQSCGEACDEERARCAACVRAERRARATTGDACTGDSACTCRVCLVACFSTRCDVAR